MAGLDDSLLLRHQANQEGGRVRLQCTQCKYTVPQWYRTKAGKVKLGYALLSDHAWAEHYRTNITQRPTNRWVDRPKAGHVE